MSTPRGNLSSISRTLKRLARYGDVAGIRAYVYGDGFLAAFNGLKPERRHSAMLVYARRSPNAGPGQNCLWRHL